MSKKQPQNRIDFILHCEEKRMEYKDIAPLVGVTKQRVGVIIKRFSEKKDRCFICNTSKKLQVNKMTNEQTILLCDKCNKKVDEIRQDLTKK